MEFTYDKAYSQCLLPAGANQHQAADSPCPDTGVIPTLARDLHNELPEEKRFFERNIKRMLAFYREYPYLQFVPQPVAQTGANTDLFGPLPEIWRPHHQRSSETGLNSSHSGTVIFGDAFSPYKKP